MEGPLPGYAPEEVTRLKSLEKENKRLKKIAADQVLDIDMLVGSGEL